MELRLLVDKLKRCTALIETCLKKDKIQPAETPPVHHWHTEFRMWKTLFKKTDQFDDRGDSSVSLYVYIHIMHEVREDLKTCLIFLQAFNGKSLMLPQYWLQSPNIDLYTDASGTLGYGAVLGPQWLFQHWDDEWRGQFITLLEFYPTVLAVSVWADSLSNKCISFHSDNRAVVDINSQTSKDTKVMHLMRKLVLSCLRHNILFRAVHISGINNNLADFVSRLQVEKL